MIPRRRAMAAIAVAAASFGLALCFRLGFHQQWSDFDQNRPRRSERSRARLRTPGRRCRGYNDRSAIGYLPFAWNALRHAAHGVDTRDVCWISGGCFGLAMSADGDAKLFALATWPYVLSASLGQWGPLLMATTAMHMLGWLAIVKSPNSVSTSALATAIVGCDGRRSGSMWRLSACCRSRVSC